MHRVTKLYYVVGANWTTIKQQKRDLSESYLWRRRFEPHYEIAIAAWNHNNEIFFTSNNVCVNFYKWSSNSSNDTCGLWESSIWKTQHHCSSLTWWSNYHRWPCCGGSDCCIHILESDLGQVRIDESDSINYNREGHCFHRINFLYCRFALSWFPQLVTQFPILQPVFTGLIYSLLECIYPITESLYRKLLTN